MEKAWVVWVAHQAKDPLLHSAPSLITQEGVLPSWMEALESKAWGQGGDSRHCSDLGLGPKSQPHKAV